MKLKKIDLKNIIAAGHEQDCLVLLIERGKELEYLEFPAPRAAYEGLQQVSDYANDISLPEQKEVPQSDLRPQSIPLFINESGVFNRVKNRVNSQQGLMVEAALAMVDEPSQTWEMLGNVNLTRDSRGDGC
ncbi:MAG: hypothetical protein WBA13_15605 [Microcoleaceae cyanobacterium]